MSLYTGRREMALLSGCRRAVLEYTPDELRFSYHAALSAHPVPRLFRFERSLASHFRCYSFVSLVIGFAVAAYMSNWSKPLGNYLRIMNKCTFCTVIFTMQLPPSHRIRVF